MEISSLPLRLAFLSLIVLFFSCESDSPVINHPFQVSYNSTYSVGQGAQILGAKPLNDKHLLVLTSNGLLLLDKEFQVLQNVVSDGLILADPAPVLGENYFAYYEDDFINGVSISSLVIRSYDLNIEPAILDYKKLFDGPPNQIDKSRFYQSCAITGNQLLVPIQKIGEQKTLYYLLEIQETSDQLGYQLTNTFEQPLRFNSDYITGYHENFFISSAENGGYKIDLQGNITQILDKTSTPFFEYEDNLNILSDGKLYASEDLGNSWALKSDKPELNQLKQFFVANHTLIGLDQNLFWYYFNPFEKPTILAPLDELGHIRFIVNFDEKILANNLNCIFEIKGLE